MRLSLLRALASLLLVAGPAIAQNGAVARGAAVITESLYRRHLEVIADDSMMGRDTPSRGLDLTSRYIAGNFRRLGMKPGGDSGSYEQRYAINRTRLDSARSRVTLRAGSAESTASFARDARIVFGSRSGKALVGPALLIGGDLDSALVAGTDVAGRMVLIVADFTRPLQSLNASLNAMLRSGVRAIIMVSNRDPGRFAQLLREQWAEAITVGSPEATQPVVAEVLDGALAPALRSVGVELAVVRAARAPIVRLLPALQLSVTVADEVVHSATAPNAVGIVPGTDPLLRNEYVVFSAHMDHEGVNGAHKADSIWNGADDDASGTAGILALAEAFAAAPARRSAIFLAVSGEEKGLWGSEYFAANPPVPIGQIVANFNLDMIGRNWKDTIVVIGKEHSDLGATLNRVNAAHPELGLSAIDDIWPHENFYTRSDHYNFARRGVPVLFFFNGVHEDYHEASDHADKIDFEKASRIVKLVYYVGQEVGSAGARPKGRGNRE